MELRERLDLFQDMIRSCHDLYLWTYDRELQLIRSNCPNEQTVRNLFSLNDTRTVLTEFAKTHRRPVIMSNALEMMWAAIPEWEQQEVRHIHILGPFFVSDRSSSVLEQALRRMKLSPEILDETLHFLHTLPVISLSRAFEYTIMLYYCITGEKISVSDLHYQERETVRPVDEHNRKADVHGTYEMEQEMVRMVREGNLEFRSHMDRLAMTGNIGTLANNDNSRQMKNAVLVCIVLFSRAAIEGGVSPEIAMTLTDHYFQSVEASRSLSELREVAVTMQNDFVQRVHNVKSRRYSKPVMDCCDYINMHLTEELQLHAMAERFGYTDAYLSRKFRQETGRTFKEYIRHQRLDRAKALLKDSSLGIRDISDRLLFCSPSYFSEQFRAEFGISPTQFREQ